MTFIVLRMQIFDFQSIFKYLKKVNIIMQPSFDRFLMAGLLPSVPPSLFHIPYWLLRLCFTYSYVHFHKSESINYVMLFLCLHH